MNWILLPLLAAVFFGTYNIFLKVSSQHINEILGLIILQAVALLVGLFLFILVKFSGQSIEITNKGFIYAALAGLFVGLAELTSFYVFSRGTMANVGIPIVIGGSVLIATLLSVFFLKEGITYAHYLGILFVILGIFLLAR